MEMMIVSICKNLTFIFFFFQAEDGIRDLIVTGVQTCALPIFDRSAVGGGLRSQEANLRQRDIRRRQAASLVLGRRAHASERSAQAPEAITGFASAIVARMRGSYHSAVRRLRASASARSSTLVAEGNRGTSSACNEITHLNSAS